MPDTDDATYRQHYRAAGEAVQVREPDEVESGEGMMEIRLPIASTGEVRNEGDDPLTRDELNGMARQLQERQIGVFPAHGGDSMIAAGRYSPFEKLGEWADAGIDSRESENVLMATARMPDPETLPAATGDYREALAILKEQATRGIAQDASIGWRDDDSFPGGVDLMEASIVGIGADWRTNTGDEAAEVVAREAVEAGADPETLVARVERAVRDTQTDDMTDDTDTDTTDEQDADGGETTERGFEDRMLEMQEEQTDLLRNLVERMDDDKDEDEEDDQEMDDDEEEDDDEDEEGDGEMSADEPESEQDADTDESDLEARIAELEGELESVRDGGLSGDDVEQPEPEAEQDADTDETEQRDTNDGGPETAGISISDL